MGVFLADRNHLDVRGLHIDIKNRFQSDDRFDTVQLTVAGRRDPGPYRVVAAVDSRVLVSEEAYPPTTGRIEVGFTLTDTPEHYWLHWIDPERDLLVGWHRDDDHPDLGQTHLQGNHDGTSLGRRSASTIDAHPLAVLEARLEQFPQVLSGVQWTDGDPVGVTWDKQN
jgi:hypothetical protein